jgi:hypothetical protein
MRGSHASGGGAKGNDDLGGSHKSGSDKSFNMATASPKEIVAHRKAQAGE